MFGKVNHRSDRSRAVRLGGVTVVASGNRFEPSVARGRMSDDRADLRLRKRVDEIRDLEGQGTELVTLFIPPDDNLQSWVRRLSSEYSEAGNIKSKRTRTNVQSALKKAKNLLQQYKQTPENGLVVFTGQVDDEFISLLFDDLPHPISESNYICDDHFHTEPVESLVTPDEAYGLIVVTRDKATIGLLVGDRIETVREIESLVMGKTRAGGQSAQRFKRIREKQKEEHFKDVAAAAADTFLDDEGEQLDVEGVLIGGTDITVDDFVSHDWLDYRIKENTLGKFNVAHGDQTGLKQLVDKAESVLQADKQSQARELMGRFMQGLRGDADPAVAYGGEEVDRALEYGAVDTILLSESLDGDRIDDLSERAENIGSDVQLVSTAFEEGEQLRNVFGGVAAVLRYEI
ncbi:peptide chain release factor 1 [Halobacteriales archaeon QH_7_66_36]|nr:MAG: peptide chain release factor 1 [Halobacteriales archaeon QH_7_66_36]